MATVLVEEQAPPNAGKVQSILDMMELQEQMGSQLLALPYRMFFLHARKEMKSGKILPLDIWRWLGLLLNRCLPCDRRILSETDRAVRNLDFTRL
jgi:hypothetical protein